MHEIDLALPASDTLVSDIILIGERTCIAAGLTRTLRGTLARYPGCIHWHFKKGKEHGTLELTWWPQGHRLWFKIAGNRAAPWVDELLPRLKTELKQQLS